MTKGPRGDAMTKDGAFRFHRLISKIKRSPATAHMLFHIHVGQLRHRGVDQYLRLQLKDVRTRVTGGRYPEAIQIEPYGGCNIRCTMCFQGKMELPFDKNAMDLDLYFRIIDEASSYTAKLYLYWRGEPLLHDKLPEMIMHAKKRNMYVVVSTNAVTLDADVSKEIIKSELDYLLVGMDGASKETYEAMRRGADFSTVCDNIETLVRLKRQQRSWLPHVALQFIVSRINQHEWAEFLDLYRSIGADSYTEKILDVYDNFTFYNSRLSNEISDLYVPGDQSKYRAEADGKLGIIDDLRSECPMAKRLVIRADGEHSLCCYDMQGQYPIGSSLEMSVMDRWETSEYAELRSRGRAQRLPLCRNCGFGLQR